MSQSVKRRIAYNTVVQAAGKGMVLLLGAGSIAVTTRYLGPDGYGRYALALMYMQLFGVMADVGLLMTVVREISKAPERTEELIGNTLTLRLLLSVVVILLASGISLLLPYTPDVRVAILLAGAPLLLGLVNTSLVAVLEAGLRMDRAVISETAGRAAALGLVVLVAALDLGFYAVMLAAAGGALVTVAITTVVTRPFVRVRFRADLTLWRALLKVSFPLGLALAINQLYFRADTLIISLFRGYDEVGAYSFAYRLLEFALSFGTIFLVSLFPVLSSAVAHDKAWARRAIQGSWDFFIVLSFPLAAGGAVLAPKVVELIGGSEFHAAVAPLRVLLLAGAIALLNGVFGYALIAKDRQKSTLWLNVVALTSNVALNFALVPAYGILAAAIVTLFSEFVILAGSYHLMRRHFDFFPQARVLAPVVAASGAMAGVLAWAGDASLIVLVPLGAVVYAGLLFAISPASRDVMRGVTS